MPVLWKAYKIDFPLTLKKEKGKQVINPRARFLPGYRRAEYSSHNL